MSRVVVHIGAPKTGTTYLQERLATNLGPLDEHQVKVPHRFPRVAPDLFAFRAALDLLGEDWGGKPGHAEGAWDQLIRKVRRRGEGATVVISHEILAAARAPAVERAKRDLLGGTRPTELHVVYTARDLGRQVPAAWQESIKQGDTRSYGRFTRAFARGKQWWPRAFDLPAVLARWGADLPPEQVHVVTVPPTGTGGPDVLWERFAAACGIDPAWAPRPVSTRNPSLGIAETQLIRRLNRNLDPAARREAHFDKLVRQMLAQQSLTERHRARPVTLPPTLHPFAVEQAERWSDWIAGSGVDLVGDVADLRPSPLDPEAAWADPDRGRPREQLAAAVAALAVMTQEAARRDDPDDTWVSKARLQGRRMRGRSGDQT